MTKFYDYINENSSNLEIYNSLDYFELYDLKNDCLPYLKNLKKDNYKFLYSGRQSKKLNIKKKKVRKNREPLDTPKEIHNLLNQKFYEKFGVKARSESLFAISSISSAISYGESYYIFPVGKNYSFIYSEQIPDLFSHILKQIKEIYLISDNIKTFVNNLEKNSEMYSEFMEALQKIIDEKVIPYYKRTKKMPKDKDIEIMVIADYVWMIRFMSVTELNVVKWIEEVI